MASVISFKDAFLVWFRIGVLSFGGPAGQIALMHRILVDEKKWLDDKRFIHALNYCMLLPGPEAQQLATYIGWLLHGVKGGFVAGLLFIIPGAIAVFFLSILYVFLGDVGMLDGLFVGLKAAVIAIVIQAMIKIAKKTLLDKFSVLLAFFGFVSLFVFNLSFPLVVLSAGLLGLMRARFFSKNRSLHDNPELVPLENRPGTKSAAFLCFLLWIGTLAGFYLTLGDDHIFTEIATFFSKMAMITFGGAYAVLSYVAQQGVESFGWLQPGEMVDGLALAETTPGPLIIVTQFVGFIAAYRSDLLGSPLIIASIGALITTWVTFLPCFLWIFAGAPYIEKLRGNSTIGRGLGAVSATVVGVIANLALWFSLNSFFENQRHWARWTMDIQYPVWSSIDWEIVGVTIIALILVFRFKWSIFPLLGTCVLLGIILSF